MQNEKLQSSDNNEVEMLQFRIYILGKNDTFKKFTFRKAKREEKK